MRQAIAPAPQDGALRFHPLAIAEAAQAPRCSTLVVQAPDGAVGVQVASLDDAAAVELREAHGVQVIGALPPLFPEWLGDRSFAEV
ncbi:MAG: trans-AT polyketide synthase/acyltransferase/oxidoreductase domain-containing protein, partial [Bradymonadia bacterium]